MIRLNQHPGKSSSAISKYLIETETDFDEAVADVIKHAVCGDRIKQYGVHDKPNSHPYVLLAILDDHNDRLDLAFVITDDFNAGVEDTWSLSTMNKLLYNEVTMAPWMLRITEAIANGESSITFRDVDDEPNPKNEYVVNSKQIEFIRSKGYTINWDRYPREYTVSGW